MHLAPWLRRTLNKVYPDHWSFLLGEIALYSFIILLLSGTYLTFFFDASMREVVYEGSLRAAARRGDVGGLRLDAGRCPSTSAAACSCASSTTGRRCCSSRRSSCTCCASSSPARSAGRARPTGCIGVTHAGAGPAHGRRPATRCPTTCCPAPGLRIISAILLSVPVIGTWAHFAVFNGDFVGEQIIGRFYIVHVLLIPAILLALIALHLLILIKQKHTQFPGPGRHRAQRRRQPALPDVRGQGDRPVLRGLRRLRGARRARADQPDLAVGPVQPGAGVAPASQPDWYIGFLDGSTRLFPPWDINLPGDYTIPALFWPTVVIAGLMFTRAGALPDHRAQADRRHGARTTCCSGRATSRCAPRSARWR